MKIWNGRILFGAGALSLGAWSISAPLLAPDKYLGTITSHQISIRAPLSGTMLWNDKDIGRFQQGEVIGQVSAEAGETDAIEPQIQALQEISDRLGQNSTEITRFRVSLMEEKLTAAKVDLDLIQHDLSEASRKRDITASLARSGVSSKESVRSGDATVQRLRLEVLAKQSAIRQSEIEIAAARKGSFIGDGYNDVPYAVQRKLDVDLRINELVSEVRRANNAATSGSRIAMPFNGAVAVLGAVKGQSVSKGDEIAKVFDCSSLSVSIDLPASETTRLSPGDDVKLEISGQAGTIGARVERVGDKPDGVPSAVNAQANRISVDLHSQELTQLCPVGRSVAIALSSRPGPVTAWLRPVFNMFVSNPAYASLKMPGAPATDNM